MLIKGGGVGVGVPPGSVTTEDPVGTLFNCNVEKRMTPPAPNASPRPFGTIVTLLKLFRSSIAATKCSSPRIEVEMPPTRSGVDPLKSM